VVGSVVLLTCEERELLEALVDDRAARAGRTTIGLSIGVSTLGSGIGHHGSPVLAQLRCRATVTDQLPPEDLIRAAKLESARNEFRHLRDKEDLVGEMIVALVRARPTSMGLARTVAHRQGIDYMRSRYGKKGEKLALVETYEIDSFIDVLTDNHSTIDDLMHRLEVETMLERESLKDYVICKLFMRGFTYQEIGEWFGVTASRISQRINRIKQRNGV
jgi:DNA-directed RNA polymerase specialized sigma24 family protein